MERSDDIRRLQRYVIADPSPKVAVFDIGTKASRLLVGPRTPPAQWERDTFFNAGEKTNLGRFVSRADGVVSHDNEGLQRVLSFIQRYSDSLKRIGIPADDITVSGTAVFRWISNQADVRAAVRKATGLSLCILDGEREALVGCGCAYATYAFRREPVDSIGDPNQCAFLMIDQGGGSADVSVLLPSAQGLDFQTKSFDKLGTVALQEWFLTTSGSGHGPDVQVDPSKNQRRISTQNNRVREHVAQEIDGWPGFSGLSRKKIVPYAMGSAVTNCVNGNNFDIHNKRLTIQQMTTVTDNLCARIDGSVQQVRTLHGLMQGPQADEIDGKLTLLYGLPVYASLLQKFGLDHVRICGYGLRYGIYAWRYMWGKGMNELAVPA